jgi:hypothetical protein
MPTHREQVLRALGVPLTESLSISDLARRTGVPAAALQEVYNRGVGAWKTNISSVRLKSDFSKNPDLARFPRSARLSKEQWGMARVYSFLNHGTTFKTTDADIARRYRLV